jgi:hypothetical protein
LTRCKIVIGRKLRVDSTIMASETVRAAEFIVVKHGHGLLILEQMICSYDGSRSKS